MARSIKPAPMPKFKRGERSGPNPAPMPKARSRQMTDVTPKKVNPTTPKPKKQTAPGAKIGGKVVLPKASGATPKKKMRIFSAVTSVTPALPSSASKMGKMNRKAY
jgi:hypothetical protein